MDKCSVKGWLYLLPAIAFLGVFMVYPLVDVFVYSFEEGYNSASQTFSGVGLFNYRYVLRDPYFLQALKNTFILVIITVPVSTGLALLVSLGLSSIEKLRSLFQTVYFLPYVTNTLAVGLVFMILFKKTAYTDGLVNVMLHWFGSPGVDFIDGPYWAKMFVLCFYTVWIVLPFKILILTSALASVKQDYYNAARVDGTPRWRIFTRITLPMISPMIFYLVITGFIGAFKAYSDAVALFGTDLNAAQMNTMVGYIYDMLYGDRVVYHGEQPFEETDMRFGTRDITVNTAYVQNDMLMVRGKNFTPYSVIYVDGNAKETTFLSEYAVTCAADDIEKGDRVTVRQVAEDGTELSEAIADPYGE